MRMLIFFFGPGHTAEACAYTAGHTLFQGNVCLHSHICRILLYSAQHRHRAACADHISHDHPRIHCIDHGTFCSRAAVHGCHIDKIRCLFKILFQKELCIRIAEHRDRPDPLCIQFLRQIEHRRDADTAAQQDHFFALHPVQVVSVAENAQQIHFLTSRIGRDLFGTVAAGTVYQTQLRFVFAHITDTDRAHQQSAAVFGVYSHELSRMRIRRHTGLQPHRPDARCKLLL